FFSITLLILYYSLIVQFPSSHFFFFTDTATTEIYTLSLHDALPIWRRDRCALHAAPDDGRGDPAGGPHPHLPRLPLRRRPSGARPCHRHHRGRARRAAGGARAPGQAARGEIGRASCREKM